MIQQGVVPNNFIFASVRKVIEQLFTGVTKFTLPDQALEVPSFVDH